MRWLCLAVVVVLLAGQVGAVQLSHITMYIDPVVPGEFQCTQTSFGLDTEATDEFDTGRDAYWPPWPPYCEARIISYVPDDQGIGCMLDTRDGAGGYADPLLAEVWPTVLPEISPIPHPPPQARITWDITQAGPYIYVLRDYYTGAEIVQLEPGGELIVDFDRGGYAGIWILEAYMIPEPSSLLLLGSAIGLAAAALRRHVG